MQKKKKKKTKQTLADAVRRGQHRNKERGLPYGRGTEHLLDELRLSRFDLQFLKLSEKGWSERQIAAKLQVGRGTIHRTKKLLGLLP